MRIKPVPTEFNNPASLILPISLNYMTFSLHVRWGWVGGNHLVLSFILCSLQILKQKLRELVAWCVCVTLIHYSSPRQYTSGWIQTPWNSISMVNQGILSQAPPTLVCGRMSNEVASYLFQIRNQFCFQSSTERYKWHSSEEVPNESQSLVWLKARY